MTRPDAPFRSPPVGRWLASVAVALCPLTQVAAATGSPASLDAGGLRSASARYSADGGLGSFGGTSTASAAGVTARTGYVPELQDLVRLTLGAANARPPERTATQLSALAGFDDGTVLPLAATEVRWSVVEGPIASLGASGLATAGSVYADTPATVSGAFQDRVAVLGLTVANVGNDDFGSYAGDGLDDAWQVRFFGVGNPSADPAADPDDDGVDNRSEYAADTDPTNRQSIFRIESVALNSGGCAVRFPSSAARRYTLNSRAAVAGGAWAPLPAQTDVPGNGGLLTLTDPAPPGSPRFYCVSVRVP